jgi:5'-AMP-activated protein kinase catalytic alpha subunit
MLFLVHLTHAFLLGKSLGKGTFGKVKQATHTLTGEKVAVKILEKDKIKDKKDVERITREIKILKKVRHPNVIQLYEVGTPFS